jgi:three-Cys-motif partner protein
VEWATIASLGATKAVDLWLLFPLGVAINRMLPRDALPPPEWAGALSRIFGTSEWQAQCYEREAGPTLFDVGEQHSRTAGQADIARFFIERLKTAFHSVLDDPLELVNDRGTPLYLLCFAAANKQGAPTAIRIAAQIVGVEKKR